MQLSTTDLDFHRNIINHVYFPLCSVLSVVFTCFSCTYIIGLHTNGVYGGGGGGGVVQQTFKIFISECRERATIKSSQVCELLALTKQVVDILFQNVVHVDVYRLPECAVQPPPPPPPPSPTALVGCVKLNDAFIWIPCLILKQHTL